MVDYLCLLLLIWIVIALFLRFIYLLPEINSVHLSFLRAICYGASAMRQEYDLPCFSFKMWHKVWTEFFLVLIQRLSYFHKPTTYAVCICFACQIRLDHSAASISTKIWFILGASSTHFTQDSTSVTWD